MTSTITETWVCERCEASIAYDDEVPHPIPIQGELCEDCAKARTAKCMDCGAEHPLADLQAEHLDWMGRTHDESRLICEQCDDEREIGLTKSSIKTSDEQ